MHELIKVGGLAIICGLAVAGTWRLAKDVWPAKHTQTIVMCEIPSVAQAVINVTDLQIEPWGFTGLDERGNRQFFMKSMMEHCYSVDKAISDSMKRPAQAPVEQRPEGLSVAL